jgi:hypothetical protein
MASSAWFECTHSMTPVLVTGYDTRGIVLVVQVPGAVRINEHAIGIVHKVLMGMELALKTNGIQILRESRQVFQ